MRVSVNLMKSGKMSCYLYQIRQENHFALFVSNMKRCDLNRHYQTKHQVEIEEKLNLILGSGLRKEYVNKKKKEIKSR